MAKRKIQTTICGNPVYRIWPIFEWTRCMACNNEFRREWGWEVMVGPYHGGTGRNGRLLAVCRECKATEDEAVDFFKTQIGPRPSTVPVAQGTKFLQETHT